MTTQIKITELTNIGNSLNQNTLVPVVNMAGTPTTQKANLQIVGNLILNNAGNGFPSANSSIYSQSVTNAAQPNITSVGTLTSLTVAGNVNLGGVANVKILGGAIGQVLTTDGAGNLSWAADGTSYGNSNVASYLPTYTGNLTAGNISVTGNISANNIGNVAELNLDGNTSNILYGNGVFAASPSVSLTGDGGNLSNINGANVSGVVQNAEFANTVFVESVNNNFSYHVVLTTGPDDYTLHNDIDDSFQYNPADGILTVTRVDAEYVVSNLAFSNGYPASNVTGLGNIAGINLNGNGNQVLGGNGAWVSQTSPTSAAGSNNEIQFNSNGAFSASGNLKFTDSVSGGTVEVGNELNLLGNGTIGTTGSDLLLQPAGNIVMQASVSNLIFDITGNLTTPSNLVISPSGLGTGTALTQSDAPLLLASLEANGKASIGWYENPTGPGNVVQVGLNDSTPGSMTVLTGDFANTTYVWDFDNTGNLTLPTGGALNTTGNIVSNGYARFSGTFDESQASTAGLYLGYAGGTSRIMFGTGNTAQTFEIDNDDGNLRFYMPGSTKATLTSTGDLSVLGNITANNLSNLVQWTTAPVANTSAGTAGQAAYDTGGNLYVCVSTNTWAKFTGTTSW